MADYGNRIGAALANMATKRDGAEAKFDVLKWLFAPSSCAPSSRWVAEAASPAQPYRTTALGSAALALISSGLFPVIKIPPIKTNDDND
jgi:hypothetical protein